MPQPWRSGASVVDRCDGESLGPVSRVAAFWLGSAHDLRWRRWHHTCSAAPHDAAVSRDGTRARTRKGCANNEEAEKGEDRLQLLTPCVTRLSCQHFSTGSAHLQRQSDRRAELRASLQQPVVVQRATCAAE